jgi:hypothetical protein
MKKKSTKIAVLMAVLVSAVGVLLADDGVQASGQKEGTDSCFPSGPNGATCTSTSYTHYGCDGGVNASCTPYNDPSNPVPVSGTCGYAGVDASGNPVYACSATS